MFKQNIVLVFEKEFDKDTIKNFWNELIDNLPRLASTDHCLLLLVINTNSNNYDFPEVNIKQQFSRDDILLWLNKNDGVQRMLNLQDEEELIDRTNIIWDDGRNDQPKSLLKAIYQQFAIYQQLNYNWEEIEEQWENF